VGTGGKPPFRGGDLPASLSALGVAREDVTDVVYTHLHADHIGWATRDGQPYFPNATHHCDRRDWDHFVSPEYEIPAWERAATTAEEDAARVRLAPLEG